MQCQLAWLVEISNVIQRPLTVPLHCPNGRRKPAVRAVQRDCETVYKTDHTNIPLVCTKVGNVSATTSMVSHKDLREYELKDIMKSVKRLSTILYKNVMKYMITTSLKDLKVHQYPF